MTKKELDFTHLFVFHLNCLRKGKNIPMDSFRSSGKQFFLLLLIAANKIASSNAVGASLEDRVELQDVSDRSRNINSLLKLAETIFGPKYCETKTALVSASKRDLSFWSFPKTGDESTWPIVLVENLETKENRAMKSRGNMTENYIHKQEPLNLIIIGSSGRSIKTMFKTLKNLFMIYPVDKFILIDGSSHTRGCGMALNYLQIAWKMDAIQTIFLCEDPDKGFIIYGYHPYLPRSQDPWILVKVLKDLRNHPLNFLMRSAEDLRSADISTSKTHGDQCSEIFFDIQRNTNGYPLRVKVLREKDTMDIEESEPGVRKYGGTLSKVMFTVLDAINATLELTYIDGDRSLRGFVFSNGTPYGIVADLAKGTYDISFNPNFPFINPEVQFSTFQRLAYVCLLIQMLEKEQEIVRMLKMFPASVIFALMLTSVIVIIFLFLSGQNPGEATLNLLRGILGNSMLRLSKVSSIRLVLASVFFCFLIVNISFQGMWLSILTRPRLVRSVETLEDILEYDFQLQGDPALFQTLPMVELKQRFEWKTYDECIEAIHSDTKVACIDICRQLQNFENVDGALLSTNNLYFQYISFPVRKGYPFIEHVNNAIMHYREAGLVKFWHSKLISPYVTKLKEKEMRLREFRVLTLSDFSSLFYILIVGYSCAFVVFLFEILHNYKKMKRL